MLSSPKNVAAMIRNLLSMGSYGMAESLMDKVDFKKDGPQLMQGAIYYKQPEMVKQLIARSVSV